MHIADVESGMLGANGIVGGGPPMVVRRGLSAKVRGTNQVAVAFFGDGGSNQGTFLESLNLPSVWKLPAIFVVENNGYAEARRASTRSAARRREARRRLRPAGRGRRRPRFLRRLRGGRRGDARARAGGGPSLLECKVNRYYGHFEGDAQTYRGTGEVEDIRATRDCLDRFPPARRPRAGCSTRPSSRDRRGGRGADRGGGRRRPRRRRCRSRDDAADRRLRLVLGEARMARKIDPAGDQRGAAPGDAARPDASSCSARTSPAAPAPEARRMPGAARSASPRGSTPSSARARPRHADLRVGVHRRGRRRRGQPGCARSPS